MPGTGTKARKRGKGPRKAPPSTARRREWFVEFVQSPEGHKVDFEKGCIYHVKVLGFDSVNNRRYTEEAIRAAIPLYDGIKVNIDHPGVSGRGKGLQPTDPRSAYDRFGKLVNPQFEPASGLYADLWFLRRHAMTRNVVEAAERMPDLFGLSHNAEGEGHDEDGVFVVEEIKEVRHVDVVADAATNKTLFESRQPARKPDMVKIPKAQAKLFKRWLAESKRAKLKRVLKELGEGYEDDDSDTGTSADGSGDSAGNYKQHLHNALGAVVNDNGLTSDQKKDKLKKFVDMMTEDDDVEDDETEDDETEDDETEDDETEDDETEADVSRAGVEDDEEEDDETEDEDTEEANMFGDETDIGSDSTDDERGQQEKTKKKPIGGAFGGSGLSTGIEGKKFKKSKDPAVRQLQEQLARANLKEAIRTACAKRKVPCTTSVMKACLALRKPRAILEHLEFLKANLKTESRLRSQGPGQGVSLEESDSRGGRRRPVKRKRLRNEADWLLN